MVNTRSVGGTQRLPNQNYTNRQNNVQNQLGGGVGRNRGRGIFYNANNRPTCQVCDMVGHIAAICFYSGACSHVTWEPNNLMQRNDYTSNERVMRGNGNGQGGAERDA